MTCNRKNLIFNLGEHRFKLLSHRNHCVSEHCGYLTHQGSKNSSRLSCTKSRIVLDAGRKTHCSVPKFEL